MNNDKSILGFGPNSAAGPTEARSANMRAVRSRNTGPELRVRSIIHRLGRRFRLHRNDLPGCPDLVLKRDRTVVFVHGCFWHSHTGCGRARLPKANAAWWEAKLERNQMRDRAAVDMLEQSEWRVVTVWECELRDGAALQIRLRGLLVE